MTFGDYRRSRYLTQAELFELLAGGVSMRTLKRWDRSEVGARLWSEIEDIEAKLNAGPWTFIKPKVLWPFSLEPMPAQRMRRLPVGECFVSFQYFEDQVALSALRSSKPDWARLVREHEGKRLVILYRVVASRYAREVLRKGFTIKIARVAVPDLLQINRFKPGGRHALRTDMRGVSDAGSGREEQDGEVLLHGLQGSDE